MDIRDHNRQAWDQQVETGNRWTIPVDPQAIAAARKGVWEVLLTPTRPVPRTWFPELKDRHVLCLASGGGQQGPIFAAVGAHVTILDNSPRQLAQDRLVAEREGLELVTLEGDMRYLAMFPDASFDLVFHPISNVFVPEVRPVWEEAYRVLRPDGILMAGFMNPVNYIFDWDLIEEKGILEVKYKIPYSDVTSLSEAQRAIRLEKGWPLEFGHTLEDQIAGQIDAGFWLNGFFEDTDPECLICKYIPVYIATRAIKKTEIKHGRAKKIPTKILNLFRACL